MVNYVEYLIYFVFREGYLSGMRKQHYDLNYFTVNQLIILRRELAKLQPNAPANSHPFDYRVLALLFDVAGHDCSLDLIRKTLHKSASSFCISSA